MNEHGFERILAIPALPSVNNSGHSYSVSVVTDSGESWSLRSMGTEFSLVSRSWLRSGMPRCYSLGWGLAASGQTACLLLAQAFEEYEPNATQLGGDLADMLRPMSGQFVWAISEMWGRPCLRLAADVGGADDR